MEVVVHDALTGASAPIGILPDDTIGDVKRRVAADLLGIPAADIPHTSITFTLHGTADQVPLGDDDTPVADAPIGAGGDLDASCERHRVRSPHTYTAPASVMALSQSSMRLAFGNQLGGRVTVWDTSQATQVWEGFVDRRPAASVAFDPPADALASAHGGNVRVTGLSRPAHRRTALIKHGTPANSVAFLNSGECVVTSAEDGRIRVWDIGSRALCVMLQGHAGAVWQACATASRVVSCSSDCTVRVWSLETCATTSTLEGHTRAVRDISISSCERLAVSASLDRTLRLWDLDQAQCLRVFRTASPLRAAVIADNGLVVALPRGGASAPLFRHTSGRAVEPTQEEEGGGIPDIAEQVALSKCGVWLFALCGDSVKVVRITE